VNFQKIRLKNGIILLHESRPLPVVSLSITNPFGAVYEEEKIKGIAHFMEHLVFTGTKTRTHEDISREIEKKGGILNAFTSHDMTSFWCKLPSKHIFTPLEIFTDMLTNPLFDEKKFEKEKKVILEEIKMYHDMPMRHIHDKIEANLYEEPFGASIIGSKETVSSIGRDFAFDYFKKVYDPSRFIVTVVGKANPKEIVSYLEQNFKPSKFILKVQEIKKHNKETVEERHGIDQAHFIFAFHAPLAAEKNHANLEVLDAYLANGMSSRLFLEIREKRGLAYAVKSSLETEKNFSYYTIYVGTTKSALSEVKKLILKEFENVRHMTETELKEAKERLIGLYKVSSEESSDVMNELMLHELTTKAEDYYEYEKNIGAVKLEDVKRIAEIKEYSTAAIVPKD